MGRTTDRRYSPRRSPSPGSCGKGALAIAAAGFGLSLAAAVCFGLYAVARRHSALDPWTYTAWFGVAVAGLGSMLWVGLSLTHRPAGPAGLWWVGAESAAIWAGASVAYVLSIDRIGVARAGAMKNLAALFGTIFGWWFAAGPLDAWRGACALVGSALVVVAAVRLGGAPLGAGVPLSVRGRVDAWGVLAGLAAAAGIGGYLVPALALVDAGGWTLWRYQAAMAVTGGLMCLLPWIVRRVAGRAGPVVVPPLSPLKAAGVPVLSGLVWFAGSVLVVPGTALAGLAIAWPVSQLGFFVTLAWGVHAFDEVASGAGRGRVRGAAAVALLALVFLGVARA